jgi:hypothetical protein
MDPTPSSASSSWRAERVAAAYRRLAKRYHPDRAGERGARRMAEINAAYDQLRDVQTPSEPVVARAGRARAAWLPDEIRERLGPELLRVLADRWRNGAPPPAAGAAP